MENDLEKSYREEISRMLTEANELFEKAEILARQHKLSLSYDFRAECDNLASSLRENNVIDYNYGWDSSEKCW